MTSELSVLATRVREFIADNSPVAAIVDPVTPRTNDTFTTLALDLFAAQFRCNAAYRKFCEARRATPATVSAWSEIPALPTTAFKEFEVTALSPAERTHVFHSSGTTEQRPSRHFHNAESLAVYEASLWSWSCANVPVVRQQPGLAILTPPPAQAPNSSLVHMFETIRLQLKASRQVFLGAIADGAWAIDSRATIAALEAAQSAARPVLIMGTAFSFVHLVDALEARGMRFELPTGSVVMETGGYKGRSRVLPKAELHALISSFLGVSANQIVCEYGMSEMSSQAYDGATGDFSGATRSRIFRLPPWARAQVISAETGREVSEGETGLLRLLDLANVFSVQAIQTEDLAIRRGTGFELLGRATAAEARGCSLMAV